MHDRTDLIADINYEQARLCFVLVALRGRIILEPFPQKKILVTFEEFLSKYLTSTSITFIQEYPLGICAGGYSYYLHKFVIFIDSFELLSL